MHAGRSRTKSEEQNSLLISHAINGSAEQEIDEILAAPPALCRQNETVASASAAWFTKFSKAQRIRIIVIVFLSSLLAGISACIYYPCFQEMAEDFGLDSKVKTGSLKNSYGLLTLGSYGSLYMWAVFTPIWGVLSDKYSRKWIQLICIAILIVSCTAIGCSVWANINNVWFYDFCSLVLAIGSCGIPAVTIRIVFEILPPSSRGVAVTFFLLTTVASVFVGPVIAGVIMYYWGWQYCYIVLACCGLISFILHLTLVPDTLNKNKKTSSRPYVELIRLMKGPEFVSVAILISLATAFLHLVYLTIAAVFPTQYGLDDEPVVIGSIYTGIGFSLGVGSAVGAGISFLLNKKFEMAGRLILPIAVVYMLGVGCLILGWSFSLDEKQVYVPILIIMFCSILRGLILPGLFTYCIELNTKNAFATIEALTVIQYLFAGSFQLLGTIMGVMLNYSLSYLVIGLLMIVGSFPVSIYLFKRLSAH